jgi:hypothetical protein
MEKSNMTTNDTIIEFRRKIATIRGRRTELHAEREELAFDALVWAPTDLQLERQRPVLLFG